jgi:hypothetical protein
VPVGIILLLLWLIRSGGAFALSGEFKSDKLKLSAAVACVYRSTCTTLHTMQFEHNAFSFDLSLARSQIMRFMHPMMQRTAIGQGKSKGAARPHACGCMVLNNVAIRLMCICNHQVEDV